MTELSEMVALARNSLSFYIGWAHETDMEDVAGGRAVPQPHHVQIINRMEDVADIILKKPGWKDKGQERHTVIVAPPGSAKTTLLQSMYEWLLGRASLEFGDNWADSFHMAHVSHSADQAWEMSYAVRNTVEHNDVFKACFPKVKPSGKWAEKSWRVQGCIGIHSTYVAMGIDGPLPGKRLNLLGLDDLIKPEEVKSSNVTPADVEAVIHTVDKVGMKRLVEGGCALLANTRWFERDPTSWAVDNGWTSIVIKALDENDESFWEEREVFSAENLIAERKRDPEGFALQFQGEPAPASGIDFKAEWLKSDYDKLPWNDAEDRWNFAVVDSWDTAGTINLRSDYTAGITAAIDLRSWNIYILNLYHAKLEFPEVCAAIKGSATSALHPQYVWVEEKSTGQSAIQQLLSQGIKIKGVPAYGQRGSPSLQVVVNQVKIVLENGRVHFPSPRFAQAYGLEWVEMMKLSLLMYPRGQHDDIPRAFIQLVFESLKAELSNVYDQEQKQLTWGEPEGMRVMV